MPALSPLCQLQSEEVCSVVSAVPGQQPVGVDRSMGADEEIRHDVLAWEEARPTLCAVRVL